MKFTLSTSTTLIKDATTDATTLDKFVAGRKRKVTGTFNGVVALKDSEIDDKLINIATASYDNVKWANATISFNHTTSSIKCSWKLNKEAAQVTVPTIDSVSDCKVAKNATTVNCGEIILDKTARPFGFQVGTLTGGKYNIYLTCTNNFPGSTVNTPVKIVVPINVAAVVPSSTATSTITPPPVSSSNLLTSPLNTQKIVVDPITGKLKYSTAFVNTSFIIIAMLVFFLFDL